MRILTVFDSEKSYTEAFARMLSREKSFPCEVRAFTERRKMEDDLRARRVAVLLVAEKDFAPEMASLPCGQLVILLEDRGSAECASLPGIRKYRPFPSVLRDLLAVASPALSLSSRDGPPGGMQVIGVGSPLRRCGNTLFSLALARLLSDSRPTLFITADPLSPLDALFPEPEAFSLSDLLYDLRVRPESAAERIRSVSGSWESLRCLPPLRVLPDALDLGTDDIASLMRECARCRFETVVLDVGLLIYDPVPLLHLCSRFYLPSEEDPVSREKLALFRNYFHESGREELFESVTPIYLPPPAAPLPAPQIRGKLLTQPVAACAMQLIRKDRL